MRVLNELSGFQIWMLPNHKMFLSQNIPIFIIKHIIIHKLLLQNSVKVLVKDKQYNYCYRLKGHCTGIYIFVFGA